MPAEARIGGGRKSRRRFGIGDFGVRGFFGKANQDMPRFFGVYPALILPICYALNSKYHGMSLVLRHACANSAYFMGEACRCCLLSKNLVRGSATYKSFLNALSNIDADSAFSSSATSAFSFLASSIFSTIFLCSARGGSGNGLNAHSSINLS